MSKKDEIIRILKKYNFSDKRRFVFDPYKAASNDILALFGAQEKCYCDCTNPECDVWHRILDPDMPCPECNNKLEPAQVEDWS